MDLMGERVASGQDITSHRKKIRHHKHVENSSNGNSDSPALGLRSEGKGGINWKKWGARIAHGKSLLEDEKPISSISRVSCLSRRYIIRTIDS